MSLQIETRKIKPGIVVVRLVGKITFEPDSDVIKPLLNDLLKQNEKRLIFDLTDVEKIDSSGTQIIVNCFLALRDVGGELRLACAGPNVTRLFKVTHLDTVMPLYATVAAARKGFTLAAKANR